MVPPAELSRQHLLAEYRELPRVFSLARDTKPGEAPGAYTLGRGHVLFFYDKLGWLADRHRSLVNEMRARGYAVNYPEPPQGAEHLYGDYVPTPEALAINRARIKERTPA